MERITVSSSLKYKEVVREAIGKLQDLGIVALFPNLDSGIKKEDVTLEQIKLIEYAHFAAIDESEGQYVICPEGHVGTLVSVEIGYAKAQDKPIFFSEEPEDLGLKAMVTKIIPLDRLEDFKEI